MKWLKKIFAALFVWNMSNNTKRIEVADAAVAITFGMQGSFEHPEPGLSNKDIAEHLTNVQGQHGFPIIAQHEIALAIDSPFLQVVSRVYQKKTSGEERYHDTAFSAQEIAASCTERGIKKVVVVAHPIHCWRVIKCLEKQGLDVVAWITKGIRYDPISIQRWCSSPWKFIPYEILLARPYYLLTGKI